MSEPLKGVLLVIDGLVHDLFLDEVKKGNLPNVQQHIAERSLVNVENAFCCHPSSTYENMQAINTGKFPFDPGATWYSRQTGQIFDYLRLDQTSKGNCAKRDTIFKHMSQWAISIHNPWNDSADDKHTRNLSPKILLQYLRGWEGASQAAVSRFLKALEHRQPLNFVELWFFSYDRFGHTIKSDESLAKRYHQLDSYVGAIIQGLQEHGMYDETLVVFLADHSMSRVYQSENPNLLCYQAGFSPRIARRRNHFDSRVFAYGYGVGQIYLEKPMTDSILESRISRMIENEAIEHVIVSTDGVKRVYSRNATIEICKSSGLYSMKILDGNNPFGYSDELCEALSKPHSAQESLSFTYDQKQPDAIVGIAESMAHPDSPDIRFLAAPGYNFGKMRNYTHFPAFVNANHVRSHGTLHRDQSHIPFIIAGPPVRQPMSVEAARIIDWMPTFLDLAGYDLPNGLDGPSLARIQ